MWLYYALGAGIVIWAYEAWKKKSSAPSAPAPSKTPSALDPGMPAALLKQLLDGVPLMTNAADLDKLAAGLESAPAPGPYPVAAAWVRQRAAEVRALEQGGVVTSVSPEAIQPSPSKPNPLKSGADAFVAAQAKKAQAAQSHPALIAAHFFALAQPKKAPALNFDLHGRALADFAWGTLQAGNLDSDAEYHWKTMFALGVLEDPASPPAERLSVLRKIVLGNPYFSGVGARGPGARRLDWPGVATPDIYPFIFQGNDLVAATLPQLSGSGPGVKAPALPSPLDAGFFASQMLAANQVPAKYAPWRDLYILGHLENKTVTKNPDLRQFWKLVAAKSPYFSPGGLGRLVLDELGVS